MRHRYALPLLLLATLLLAAPVAAQSAGTVVVAVEPPVAAAGETVNVVARNFSWSHTARLSATLNSGDADAVVVAEELRLGVRRRATLPAGLSPGYWWTELEAQWVFGDTLALPPAVVVVATAGSTTGTLAVGDTVEGVVTADPDWDDAALGAWTFDLATAQSVTLRAQPQGAGRLRLSLLGVHAEEYGEGDGLLVNQALPAGRYIVALTAEATTAYTLALTAGLSGDSEGGPLSPGTVMPGLLSPTSDTDEYTFNAAPGDVVYAVMAAAEAGLDPFLELVDPAGNVVGFNDDTYGSDAALAYVVPAAGNYVLRLSSYQGASQGSYTVELTLDPEAARLTPPTVTSLGQTVDGRVPRGGAQAWRVAGRAGQTLAARVTALSAGFDPHLTLYAPDGGQLAFNDDGAGGLDPQLAVTLPADGDYTLVVGSYTGQPGDYRLTTAGQPFPTPTP